MSDADLQPLYDAIVLGALEQARDETQAALAAGAPADRILNDGLIKAMAETGRRFEAGEFYVPEMLIAARAMKGCLEILRPALVASEVQPVGRVVIGTVAGDLHDIGKNLVSMMLEGAGFEVLDLGVDVPPRRFVEAVQQGAPDIVAMSALLTTTMAQMAKTLEALHAAGIRDRAKVIVGGAPITEAFAANIGADGYAPDASRAATLARQLISGP
jgi:5-methyltetrahydrofolate--homocysteine methyltransferase